MVVPDGRGVSAIQIWCYRYLHRSTVSTTSSTKKKKNGPSSGRHRMTLCTTRPLPIGSKRRRLHKANTGRNEEERKRFPQIETGMSYLAWKLQNDIVEALSMNPKLLDACRLLGCQPHRSTSCCVGQSNTVYTIPDYR